MARSALSQGDGEEFNSSLDIYSRSRLKEKHYLSLDKCSRVYSYWRFCASSSRAQVNVTHIHKPYCSCWSYRANMQKALINSRPVLRWRHVHINCTHSFQVQLRSLQVPVMTAFRLATSIWAHSPLAKITIERFESNLRWYLMQRSTLMLQNNH